MAAGSSVQTVIASSNCGARARISPSTSMATLCPSNTSSSCPPTRLQNSTATLLSRARCTSIASRSSPLPAWYGEADRFTITRAPDSASSVSGGPGSQMSSQIVRPIGTPFSSISAPSSPDWK